MASRPDYAFYPPTGRADYCVTLLGGGRYGVSRQVRTNTMPEDTPLRYMYDKVHREATDISVASREEAIDAMWTLAATEGRSVPGLKVPPHQRNKK